MPLFLFSFCWLLRESPASVITPTVRMLMLRALSIKISTELGCSNLSPNNLQRFEIMVLRRKLDGKWSFISSAKGQ